MDHPVGGGINKWHVRLLFHSEPHMKEEERKTDGGKKKEETFSPSFVANFNVEFNLCHNNFNQYARSVTS